MELLGPLPSVNPEQVFGLFAALVLGALIGLERLYRRHPAGLHTPALVALGSAAFVIAGTLIGDESGPARVAGRWSRASVSSARRDPHRGRRFAGSIRRPRWGAPRPSACSPASFRCLGDPGAVLVLIANIALHLCEHHFSKLQEPEK